MQSFRIIKPAASLVPYVRHYWVLSDDALAPVSERTLPVSEFCGKLISELSSLLND